MMLVRMAIVVSLALGVSGCWGDPSPPEQARIDAYGQAVNEAKIKALRTCAERGGIAIFSHWDDQMIDCKGMHP